MNIAARPPAPPNALITEAVQLIEETGPLDDAAAMREALCRSATLPERVAHRAGFLAERTGLQEEVARVRSGAPWVAAGLVMLVVIVGLTLAGSVIGGAERRINIFAALISLLGAHALTLLLWFGGLVLPLPAPKLSFGWLWMTLTARVAGGRRGQAPLLLRAATRLLVQARLLPWSLGLVSHAIWTLSFLAALGALLFALAVHRYTLSWETTILEPQFFLQAVQALGRVPAWFGFTTPEAAAVLSPATADAADQRTWALWLVGCIAVYGLLPRLLLLMLSAAVWQARKGRLQPDLSTPYYLRLASRFEAMAPAAVVDADPGLSRPPLPPYATDTTDALLIVAYELPPEQPWPAAGELPVDATVLRTDGSADARRELLDTAARLRPRLLVLACRAAASPDRGIERLLRELLTHCGECRLWLMSDGGLAVQSGDAGARWRQWLADTGLSRAVSTHGALAPALQGR